MKSIVTTILLVLGLTFMAIQLGWLNPPTPLSTPPLATTVPGPDCSAPALSTQALQTCLGLIDPAKFKLRYTYRRFAENFQNERELARATPARLHTGDKLKLRFTPPQESYVYLFYLSPRGELEEFTEQHRVVPGQEYILPSAEVSFEMTRETGLGVVYFFAFNQENIKLQADFRELQQARERGDTAAVKALSAKLVREYLESITPLMDILEIQHLPLEVANHASSLFNIHL